MKKRAIRFDWWEAVVEVDLTTQTLELMKEQLLFWTGGQQMIDDADGCIETAYLRMLGQALIRESMDLTLTGIIKEYESKEGWGKLDGTHGVKLISVDEWQFNNEDFRIGI